MAVHGALELAKRAQRPAEAVLPQEDPAAASSTLGRLRAASNAACLQQDRGKHHLAALGWDRALRLLPGVLLLCLRVQRS